MTTTNPIEDLVSGLELAGMVGKYAWRKSDLEAGMSAKVASIMSEALVQVPEATHVELVAKVGKAVKEYMETEEANQLFTATASKVMTSLLTQVSAGRSESARRMWCRGEIIGRTLVQGLTYAKCLDNPGAIAILCTFLFGDVMDLPVVVTGALCKVIQTLYSSVTNQQPSSLNVQLGGENPLVEETLTALWQALSLVLGYTKAAPEGFFDKTKTLLAGLDVQAKSTTSVLRFFGLLCKTVHRIYVWIADKVFGVHAFNRLLYQDRKVMETWAREVQDLTDPANEYLVIDNLDWHNRLVGCYLVGKYLVQEVCRAGIKDVPPTLVSSHKRLTEIYQKASNLGVTTAFRPEPVCLWVSGPAGLGKSFSKDVLTHTLLQGAGVPTTGNDVFTVNFTQKHWTGAENKAVVYYDDFGTIDDATSLGEGIGTFMQLISDARFSPPQAGLEDKGKPVAPVLVYCNANEGTPHYNVVRNQTAFLRRRHIMVEVARSLAFIKAFGHDANLETEAVKSSLWLKHRVTPENPTPQAVYYFCDPIDGRRMSGAMEWQEYSAELVKRFVERYNESQLKYEDKRARALTFASFKTDTPLVEVISEIEKRISMLSSSPTSAVKTFREIYCSTLSWTQGGVETARSWLKDLLPSSPLETQLGEEAVAEVPCECEPRTILWLTIRDDKLVWNGPVEKQRDGIEYVYTCKSTSCIMRNSELLRANRLRVVNNEWYGELFDKLYAIIQPQVARRHGPPTVDAHTLTDSVLQCTSEVKQKVWSNRVQTACLYLAGVACAFTTCMCMKTLVGCFEKEQQPVGRPRQATDYDGLVPREVRAAKGLEKLLLDPKSYSDDRTRTLRSAELISSGDAHTSRATRIGRGVVRKALISQVVEREALDTQGCESFLPLLDRAIGYLVLDGVDRASQKPVVGLPMRVFCLVGTWVIVPKHYLSKISRTTQVSLRFFNFNATSVVNEVTIVETQEFASSELALLKLNNAVPHARDMRKHIMLESESVRLTSKGYAYEKVLGQPAIVHPLTLKVEQEVTYSDSGVTFVLPSALTYSWQASGRCMTPIFSSFSGDRIVGFHVAGGDVAVGGKGQPVGCAEPVVREMFYSFSSKPISSAPVISVEGYCEGKEPNITVDTNVSYIGCVAANYSAHVAENSSIVPTLIHGYVEPTTRPAPLAPKDVEFKFSPLISGVEKHGQPPLRFDEKLLEQAKNALRDQYLTSCKPVRVEVGLLTVEEAVLGLPGVDGYQAMELGTSEGFPWIATRPAGESGKRYLFEISDDRECVSVDRRVLERMRAYENMRSKGIVPLTVFTDCLKDARISRSKFYVPGKTRVFSISPVDYTIEFRRYFLDLLAAQKVNRLNLEHAVGINVHSMEWTQLARRIVEKGTNILCGDYTNFGPGLSSQVVAAVGEVWGEWYEHHERRCGVSEAEITRRKTVRHCMIEEMRHSIHLCREMLYQALCGSPSGAPCTVNLNNDVNKIYIYMAWLDCFKDIPLMATIVAFRQHVRLYVYGDDLIAGISDAVIGKFNNQFIQSFLAKHGVVYTDESKSGDVRTHVSFSEASFLKGKWRAHDTRAGVLTYAQDIKSIEDVANWTRKGADDVESTRQAVCDSLMLAYGQGKAYFESHRERLISAWSEKVDDPVGLSLYSYDEMERMRFGWSDSDTSGSTIEQLVELERAWRAEQQVEKEASCGLMSLLVPAE